MALDLSKKSMSSWKESVHFSTSLILPMWVLSSYDKSQIEVNCSKYTVMVPIMLIQGFEFMVNCDTDCASQGGLEVKGQCVTMAP